MTQSPALTVVVVEDEAVSRAGVVRLVESDPELRCIAAVGDVASATATIRALAPDIVVLDIQLADGTGFDVVRECHGSRAPVVLFVTAFSEFAVDAFDACALDYVVKPFDDARFAKAMTRSKQACRDAESARVGEGVVRLLGMEATQPRVPKAEPAPVARLAIKSGQTLVFVPTDDIDWIEADDYYARVHAAGKSYLIRETLADLSARLDASRFCRVHRSAIVNVTRVRQIEAPTHGEHVVVLRDGARVAVTRARQAQLEQLLGVG